MSAQRPSSAPGRHHCDHPAHGVICRDHGVFQSSPGVAPHVQRGLELRAPRASRAARQRRSAQRRGSSDPSPGWAASCRHSKSVASASGRRTLLRPSQRQSGKAWHTSTAMSKSASLIAWHLDEFLAAVPELLVASPRPVRDTNAVGFPAITPLGLVWNASASAHTLPRTSQANITAADDKAARRESQEE